MQNIEVYVRTYFFSLYKKYYIGKRGVCVLCDRYHKCIIFEGGGKNWTPIIINEIETLRVFFKNQIGR